MKNLDWTEKYRPRTLSQVIGHNKAVEELRQWAQSWEKRIPKDRAVVIYGRVVQARPQLRMHWGMIWDGR